MGFLSDIFDPGKKDRAAAAQLAQQGIIKGGNVSGPGGISSGYNFANGTGSSTSSLGSFQSLLDSLQGIAGQGLNQAGQSLQDIDGLSDVFNSSIGTASADPFELGAGISEKLRALSERRNSRLVNKTFDRLKASGKLGTTGGAGIAGELDANLSDEGLKFDLAGLEAGKGLQSDAFGRVNSVFSQFLNNQQQGANIGIGATGAASGLSQLPIAFQQAMMQMMHLSSNSNFAAAGVNQNNAQMAKSPFLEALGAAGQFIGAIKPEGF